ncbi:unnamed protein product, partial [Natator depressus]
CPLAMVHWRRTGDKEQCGAETEPLTSNAETGGGGPERRAPFPLLALPAAAYGSPPARRARGADRDSQLGAIALRPPAAPYGALGSPLSVSPEPLSAGPEVAREAGAQVPPRLRRPERRPNHLRAGLRLPPRPSCALHRECGPEHWAVPKFVTAPSSRQILNIFAYCV